MRISIIMPTYNRAHIIERAIKSILKQKYNNWELIIIDDGSSDNTSEIVNKYLNCEKIKYISYPNNRGVNYARNIGIEKSTGEIITFLDSDDEFFDYTLEKAKSYIDKYNDFDIYFFATQTQNGIKKCMIKDYKISPSFEEILSGIKIKGEFLGFVKKQVFNKYKFIEELNGFEGLAWYRILKEYRAVYIDEVLRIYWQDTESITRPKKLTESKLLNLKKGLELKLELFGEELKKYNLRGYEGYTMTLAVLAKANILLGNKKTGLFQTFTSLRYNPLELRAWRNLLLLLKM